MAASSPDVFETRHVTANGIDLAVAVCGPQEGVPIVLLHGWPHTRELWRPVAESLCKNGFRAIAPDLRGIGDSARPDTGYDVSTLAGDFVGLLDALEVPRASVVGIDAGVAPAFYMALTAPDRASRLVVMEGLLPGLAGAERFSASGPPWWFGFHSVPGLAENVLLGHEDEYLLWFLDGPSVRRDIGDDARSAFIRAYRGKNALRAGFEYYRSAPRNAELLSDALDAARLTVPTLAVSGGVVGDALAHQLAPLADDLTRVSISDCGHIVPLERPAELAATIMNFADPSPSAQRSSRA